MHRLEIHGAKITRFQAEQLLSLGFSKAHLIDMRITDDLATLRKSFSGLWGVAQIFAFLLFIFPYTWFLGSKMVQREALKYGPVIHTIYQNTDKIKPLTAPLIVQLYDFIHDRVILEVLIFYLLIAINISRLVLLWKTKKEEHIQNITGLPSSFSFEINTKWKIFFDVNRFLLWINYAVVLVHTVLFLLEPFPV